MQTPVVVTKSKAKVATAAKAKKSEGVLSKQAQEANELWKQREDKYDIYQKILDAKNDPDKQLKIIEKNKDLFGERVYEALTNGLIEVFLEFREVPDSQLIEYYQLEKDNRKFMKKILKNGADQETINKFADLIDKDNLNRFKSLSIKNRENFATIT